MGYPAQDHENRLEFDVDRITNTKIEYERDDDGNVATEYRSEIVRDSDGDLIDVSDAKIEYERREDGEVVREVKTERDPATGDPVSQTVRTDDKDGKLESEETTDFTNEEDDDVDYSSDSVD